MTKPKMVRCEGSGQRVDGPDEPDGTVFCSVCGTSFVLMKKTTLRTGEVQLSVAEHKRRANPYRRRIGVRPTPPSRRPSRRDSGRRR